MSDRRPLPVRADLQGRPAYGAPQVEAAVRLNTNENPFPPPPRVLAALTVALARAAAGVNRYPDREATEVRRALAAYLGDQVGVHLDGGQLWAANGSNEVLQQLLQLFGGAGRTALGFEPSYSMHPLLCRVSGTAWVSVPRDEQFRVDPGQAARAVSRHDPDLVFLTSPNNPTGGSAGEEVLLALLEAARGVVVVDEAYGEFSAAPSALTHLAGHPRLVVTRTMSKAFALAGVRLGYLAASAELVEALHLVRLPYHLSALTQAAALTALAHSGELLEGVQLLVRERERVASQLAAQGVRTLDSDANFLLVAVKEEAEAWAALLDRGVLVRDVGLPGWLRVSIGSPEQNEAFLQAAAGVMW